MPTDRKMSIVVLHIIGVIYRTTISTDKLACVHSSATPGGVLGKILMEVCRWDSETLNLYQTTFMSFLQTYSRLDGKNPYPIPD